MRSSLITVSLAELRNSYEDAPREGVRRVLEWFTGKSIPRSQKLGTKYIKYLRMGTTVATNALLERKGEKCALLTASRDGFRRRTL